VPPGGTAGLTGTGTITQSGSVTFSMTGPKGVTYSCTGSTGSPGGAQGSVACTVNPGTGSTGECSLSVSR
jgi:hypothetical protein